jgi:methionyl-tRNA formyltransferase
MTHDSCLMTQNKINFVFWGTSEFSVYILNTLKSKGYLPALIVSTPDKPQGRKLEIKPTLTKIWAEENDIPVLQPDRLKDNEDFFTQLSSVNSDVFIVASYGKIIPERILNLPKFKTLNVHPSLLPKLRGPSPIETAILKDIKKTGVSIMRLDKEMDHGPILAQVEYNVPEWPKKEELEKTLGDVGGELLANILPKWVSGEIEEIEQDHSKATYCVKIEKNDALLDLAGNPYLNFRKVKAYSGWPNAFFFLEKDDKKIRVVVKDAKYENGDFIITRVIPEGKKEMSREDFMRGQK